MASASSPRRSRRKALALMEVVSYGTPQRLFAREGQRHRVSPQPKPCDRLQASQVGIKRTLVSDSPTQISPIELTSVNPTTLALIQGLVKSAVADALQQARQSMKEEILAEIRNELGVTLRSLISEWVKSPSGKVTLEKLTKELNKAYTDNNIQRRVMAGDVLQEIKHFIKGVDADDARSETAKSSLKIAQQAIERTSNMPGDEFVALITSYLQTNQHVHVQWSQEKLQDVVNDAKEGKLQAGGESRCTWINKMAIDIANARGWLLNV